MSKIHEEKLENTFQDDDTKYGGNSRSRTEDDPEENDQGKNKSDQYFIDEEFLEELNKNATAEEKLINHQKALETKNEGNNKFREGKYDEAAQLYTEGLILCPLSFVEDRAILYGNRAAARAKLDDEEKKGSILDCDKAVSLNPLYVKALQRRAKLHREIGHLEESLRDYKLVLEVEPGNIDGKNALRDLPQEIEEKNEQLKKEMMEKLKDLGNMILKPFGLSTENFQMNQSSETGGYNINFKQNPT